MEYTTIKSVSDERCTGCGACNNICPSNAITMEYNDEGFIYPCINENICVHCGACFAACPEMDFEKTECYRHARGKSYAVMASDDIRWMSSSGGMFTLLANYVLNLKGIVFGAAYSDDCMSVVHIGIDSKNELYKLRSSKYVQSDIGKTYSQVKDALLNNKKVLFTGCPCQIAGLYRYLGSDDNNLITADLVCHAANSTSAYRSFVAEIAQGRKIKEVDFRKKEHYGWITNVNIYFEDGSKYIENPDKSKAEWYIGFLRGIINRKCCYSCHYTQLKRMGDFTLGDFWKVSQLNKDWNDTKGTSLVLVNTPKGNYIFDILTSEMKLCAEAQFDEEFARKANGQLVRPTKQHQGRKIFFESLKKKGFHNALQDALKISTSTPSDTKVKLPKVNPSTPQYDIGLTGYWWSTNYGSVATYYALYRILESMGFSVILLDRPEKEKHKDGLDVFSRKFMERRVNISKSLGWDKLDEFNDLCKTFMIGSDQVWSPGAITAYKYFFFLDFIHDHKKIAYAASFGEHFNVEEDKLQAAQKYIKQFEKISVRERQAVDICWEKFEKKADWVMDPVFLLDRLEWEELARKSKRTEKDILGKESDYILSYILDPSEEKRNILLEVSSHLNLPLINILHGKAHSFEKNNKILNLPNTVENVEEEEWLYFFKNAKYIITDSQHGSIFSIIFNKDFICCSDKQWGRSRYESLFGLLELKDRWRVTVKDIFENDLLQKKIDYKKVNAILGERVTYSKSWLADALQADIANAPEEKALEDAEKYFADGDSAMRQKDWPEAIKRWALMREKFPQDPRGYVKGALALKENKKLNVADALVQDGLEKFPNETGLYLEYIDIARRQKNYKEMARRAALMQQKIPGHPRGYIASGVALRVLGNYEEADAHLLAALKKFPNKAEAYIEYGYNAIQQKNWPEALKRWTLVWEKFPQDPRGYIKGALALKENKEFGAADALVLKGLEKFPKEADLYLEYIAIARRQKNYEELARRGALMQQKIPEHLRGYMASGMGLRELGNYKDSDAHILAGLERFPDEAELYIEYGLNAVCQKNWPEAVKRWALMREKYPQDLLGYVNGALALKENGEFDAADTLVLQGLARFPKEPSLYLEYIDIARRQENDREIRRREAFMQRNIPGRLTSDHNQF